MTYTSSAETEVPRDLRVGVPVGIMPTIGSRGPGNETNYQGALDSSIKPPRACPNSASLIMILERSFPILSHEAAAEEKHP